MVALIVLLDDHVTLLSRGELNFYFGLKAVISSTEYTYLIMRPRRHLSFIPKLKYMTGIQVIDRYWACPLSP